MNTTATAKQVAFIKKLIEEHDISANLSDAMLVAVDKGITKRHASLFIEDLMASPKKQAVKPDAPKYAGIEDGMYINDNTGRIFKVQHAVHGSGNQYAKELIEGRFEYVRGAIQFVRQECRRMTMEDAKKYGAVYGTCCVCSRTLTNEDSIEAGIGPVCSGRL